jgi:hypothetical protein
MNLNTPENPTLSAASARSPRKRPTRRGGGRGCFSRNNYVAEAAPKAPPGAKPGNRNAQRHGTFSREKQARAAARRHLIRKIERACRLVNRLARADCPPDLLAAHLDATLPSAADWKALDDPRAPLPL